MVDFLARARHCGLPLVDASATFKGPARMDDEIRVISWVDDWKGKTFIVRHSVIKDDEVIDRVRKCAPVLLQISAVIKGSIHPHT